MPFYKTDIGWFLSGGTSNTDINLSLGNGISNTAIVSAVDNNLFPDTTPTQAVAGITRYRCFYVKNLNGTMSLQSPKIWIMSNTISVFDEIDIALGKSAKNGVEPAIATETTEPDPVNIIFTHPTSEVIGLLLPNLDAGEWQAVWVRQTVNANADPIDLNACIIRVRGTPI